METLKYGDIEMRHGDMESWTHGHKKTWTHGHMGDIETWRHGHGNGNMDMETWT
jgi:hypothetical protein